jgi:hypothetical protein
MDPIFAEIEATEGYEIALEDISSSIGLNWVRKNVLEASGLLRDPETSAQELQQLREDTGFHLDIQTKYAGFFGEDVFLERYFTPYGYFNINVSDEFALRKLFYIRTGDEVAAEMFHLRIQASRLKRQEGEWIDAGELSDLLGIEYPRLFPLINAEPCINANFAEAEVLTILLAACQVKNPENKLDSILQSRLSRPLNPEAIEFIMGEDYEGTAIGQYLGSVTWFWRLRVSAPQGELIWILLRLPPGFSGPDVSLRIIEERYEL